MDQQGRAGEPVTQTSADVLAERLAALHDLFPEAFTEGKVDLAKLRTALGEAVEERQERYRFTWAGKQAAIEMLKAPSRATLKPIRGESVAFDTTRHLFIEGDNLEVLKLLYKAYFGRVKMIYIDPPYNTGNDFIYPDSFADSLDTYLKLTGQRDGNGHLLTSNPETNGRYHSAWLSMMYPRLFLARQLLREDGVLLVSIDDKEVANLRLLMNEIFGEENFVANIVWQKRYVSNVTAQLLSDMHDHILVYARQREMVKVNRIPRSEEQLEDYKNPDNDPRGPWRAQDLSASKPYSAGLFTITTPVGIQVNPPPGRYWRCNKAQYQEWFDDNRIWFGKSGTGRPMLKAFLSEVQEGLTPNTWWSYEYAGHNKEATLEVKGLFDGRSPFDTAKPVKLVRRMVELFTDSDSVIVDFFAGSCTTAHAVLEVNRDGGGNRRFIMVQLPEATDPQSEAYRDGYRTITKIGEDRIRHVIAKLEGEQQSQLALSDRSAPEDLGMRVFRLAESTMRQWEPLPPETTPDAYSQQLALFHDPLLPGWQPEDVIWEVALKEGLSLSSTLARVPEAVDAAVWRVTDRDKGQSLLICLDDRVTVDAFRPLSLTQDDILVCRDIALDDTTAANLTLQCRLKTI